MDDLKILLNEYSKLVASNPNNIETPAVIPVLLRHGHFSPARLDRWPFTQIASEMDTNLQYRQQVIQAFLDLVTKEEVVNNNNSAFTLNEKKGIAFLSATRDSFPQIHAHLNACITSIPRINLAALEYVSANDSSQFLKLPCPFPQIQTLAPKLSAKYPLLLEFFDSPTITAAKTALERLKASLDDPEAVLVLECTAQNLNSKEIYAEILQPVWGIENDDLVCVVLKALCHSADLKSFCEQSLTELSSIN